MYRVSHNWRQMANLFKVDIFYILSFFQSVLLKDLFQLLTKSIRQLMIWQTFSFFLTSPVELPSLTWFPHFSRQFQMREHFFRWSDVKKKWLFWLVRTTKQETPPSLRQLLGKSVCTSKRGFMLVKIARTSVEICVRC